MKEINDEEFFEIMDNLNGHTTAEEHKQFMLKLQTDPIWEDKVKSVEKMQFKHRYIEAKMKLQPIIEEVFREQVPTEETKVIPIWKRPPIWLAAASVVGLIILGTIKYEPIRSYVSGLFPKDTITYPPNPSDTNTISPPLPIKINIAGALRVHIDEPAKLNSVPKRLTGAYEAINGEAGRKNAIKRLEDFSAPDDPRELQHGSSQEPTEDRSVSATALNAKEESYRKLLLGIGYIKTKKGQKALTVLNQVVNKDLSQDVSWYKALAYLQSGKNKEARAELVKITDNRYLKNANELLAALPQ
ncbi:MAG: hypothetical protein U0X91_27820 [Spirosomataceae bacterium]